MTSCLLLPDSCGGIRLGECRRTIVYDFFYGMQVFFGAGNSGAETDNNRTGLSRPEGSSGESVLQGPATP